jgi:uncharacterized protein (TIGR02147 family)
MMNQTNSVEHFDFRIFLQNDLVSRMKKNPKYSLRAYSKFLGVNSGTLSRLLSGSRPFTPQLIKDFCSRLSLEPEKTLSFLHQVSRTPARPLVKFDQIAIDHFHVIADWYHYALLELTRIDDFESSAQFVSKALGVPVMEIKAAVERLVRLGYLEIQNGKWVDCSGLISTVGQEWTTPALRKLQKQVLEKAIEALELTPYEKREQTSLTMAIDSKQLPKAKKMIRKFNEEFTALIESAKKRDQVYHCSVSFYPVTQIEGNDL